MKNDQHHIQPLTAEPKFGCGSGTESVAGVVGSELEGLGHGDEEEPLDVGDVVLSGVVLGEGSSCDEGVELP